MILFQDEKRLSSRSRVFVIATTRPEIYTEIKNCGHFARKGILPVGNRLATEIKGLPWCNNLTRFSLFCKLLFCCTLLFKMVCFLWFTSSMNFTGSYTEAKPKLGQNIYPSKKAIPE